MAPKEARAEIFALRFDRKYIVQLSVKSALVVASAIEAFEFDFSPRGEDVLAQQFPNRK